MTLERCDVLMTSPLHPDARNDSFARLDARVLADCNIDGRPSCLPSVVIARDGVPPEWIEMNPRLSGVVRHGTGTDYIPLDTATKHGVLVANLPDVNPPSVAEHAIAMMLSLQRGLGEGDRLIRAGGWTSARMLTGARRIGGRRLGIVGSGAVARSIVTRLDGWNVGIRMSSPSGRHIADLPTAPLEQLMAWSDVLILATSLTPKTHHLINRENISFMRKEAMLVNVSRGALVDQDALFEALASGLIRGAALDVFEHEPYAPHHAVTGLNVLMSPHVAGGTTDDVIALSERSMEAAVQILSGSSPEFIVNTAVLPAWRKRQSSRIERNTE